MSRVSLATWTSQFLEKVRFVLVVRGLASFEGTQQVLELTIVSMKNVDEWEYFDTMRNKRKRDNEDEEWRRERKDRGECECHEEQQEILSSRHVDYT